MKELTPQQRMHIFMLYPNAKYLFHGATYSMDEIDLLNHGVTEYAPDGSGDFVSSPIVQCQLKLFSLDQITEEHKRELATLVRYEDADTIDFKDNTFYFTGSNDDAIWMGWTEFINLEDLPYPAADFLRKHNYAIPYEGIDLYEAGVAIRTESNK
jgi:hypothetical protein